MEYSNNTATYVFNSTQDKQTTIDEYTKYFGDQFPISFQVVWYVDMELASKTNNMGGNVKGIPNDPTNVVDVHYLSPAVNVQTK